MNKRNQIDSKIKEGIGNGSNTEEIIKSLHKDIDWILGLSAKDIEEWEKKIDDSKEGSHRKHIPANISRQPSNSLKEIVQMRWEWENITREIIEAALRWHINDPHYKWWLTLQQVAMDEVEQAYAKDIANRKEENRSQD
jgi:hypothetical protein